MGANWIHGTSDNPILDLAKQTKTAIGSWDGKPFVFDEEGQLFPIQYGEECSVFMWDIILDAFRYSEKHSHEISPDESLLDFFRTRIVEVIAETTHDWKRKREIVMHMAELWGAFVGSPITRQSLKFFWLEECIEGGMSIPSPGEVKDRADMSHRESVLCRDVSKDSRRGRQTFSGGCHDQTWI